MTEKTIIATNIIAKYLNELMQEKGISTYKLRQAGINAHALNSVLKRGNHKNKNYTIETFIEVLSQIGVHLEFHDLQQKSNLDLDKTDQN